MTGPIPFRSPPWLVPPILDKKDPWYYYLQYYHPYERFHPPKCPSVKGMVTNSFGDLYLLDPPDNIPEVTVFDMKPCYMFQNLGYEVQPVMGIDITFQLFLVTMINNEFNSLTFRVLVLNEIPAHSCDARIIITLQSFLYDLYSDGLGIQSCGHEIRVKHLFHGCLANGDPSHYDYGSVTRLYKPVESKLYYEEYDSSLNGLLGDWNFTPSPPTVTYRFDSGGVSWGAGWPTTIPEVVPAGSKIWVYTGLDVTIEGGQGCFSDNLAGTIVNGGIGSIVYYTYIPE